jgi:stress response protein SCP2
MDSTETGSAIDAKITALKLNETYATVAQGAKADSALQSVEAGLGLKVSTKADNKQTIDIDNSVVFVFNCGSATELVD